MSEGEATAGCEACAKAPEEWLKGDYMDMSSSVAAMLGAYQRTHHAEIAGLHAELAALRAENVRLREYVRNAGDTFAGLTGEHGIAGLAYFREKKVWLGRMLDEASRALKGAEA